MAILRCPICKSELFLSDNAFKCKKGHSFDKGKSGYVNLLTQKQMNSALPGDNKLMVRSRRNFLDKGYYSALQRAVQETVSTAISQKPTQNPVLLDAGCGEGYYTLAVSEALHKNGLNPDITGVDISKFALDYAGRRNPNGQITYAVASAFHLPIADNSVDLLLTMFAPYSGSEYARVLKNGAFMVMAIPDERHLFGLKSVVYENPYLNEVKDYELEGFTLREKILVSDSINLTSSEDIENLFSMTPYYYKSPKDGASRLRSLQNLVTEIAFQILVYSKNG